MPTGTLRVVLLWHMHQPYYKDLVTGEYRLPWVRLHALKDYYGMVKLLDEFPDVHQNFNLVPSLVTQIEDYVAGSARDPFLDVAAKPAAELSPRRTALRARISVSRPMPTHMIGRYPRYRELVGRVPRRRPGRHARRAHVPARRTSPICRCSRSSPGSTNSFSSSRTSAELIKKGREVLARRPAVCHRASSARSWPRCCPPIAAAAKRGAIELSTSPFYHPILPLVCDTDSRRGLAPGLPLPQTRFPSSRRRARANAARPRSARAAYSACGREACGHPKAASRSSAGHRAPDRAQLDGHRRRRARPHSGLSISRATATASSAPAAPSASTRIYSLRERRLRG